jgi:hypothetical protein
MMTPPRVTNESANHADRKNLIGPEPSSIITVQRRCNFSTPPQGETRIDGRPEFFVAFSQPIKEPVETPPV